MSSDRLVPFRWPAAWTGTECLQVLAGSPINCLVFDRLSAAGPVATQARGAGFTVLEWSTLSAAPLSEVKWGSSDSPIAITGLPWPRIKLSPAGRPDEVEAGPTGAPWIDSNSWVVRLAAVRAARRPIWLGFETARNDPSPDAAAYTTAIADSAAAGARWMIRLDDALSRGLPAGNADALRTWHGIVDALAFFEANREWAAWEPWGSVGILSTFTGKDEFLSQEVLNLAARRNLLYRVLDRSMPSSQNLRGLRGVLYVDNDSPSASWKAQLSAFAEEGGLLIVPQALASQFSAGNSLHCPVLGYDLRRLGKGSVATATRDWDDPYFLAADVHSLVQRRHDPVRLFNAGSVWEHYSTTSGGSRALLQLVSFTSRPNPSISVALPHTWRSISMYVIGAAGPAALTPVKVEGRSELHLPEFSSYAAVEFRS